MNLALMDDERWVTWITALNDTLFVITASIVREYAKGICIY
jgi:hypothetical protein